jgi:hypothetical protein
MSDAHYTKWCGIKEKYDGNATFAGFLTYEEHQASVKSSVVIVGEPVQEGEDHELY